ncbi:hypothetical protein E3Q22_03483 [Wallemia mellicola]|uniref:Sld7 C-terminal domain-containing protein n=1 Tax=Wallemia mellicola TaxID=1708541 RepID=A0A4V4MSB5_9BASI|nr:hypothetical protein E3Q24_03197 [Wallemia mellicola]TIB76566.1 hypothetical protein E3Q22_03483 [Wallemia mellicola]TIB82601.1 hypothetical protein E3Q21_03290 [Wallemia mellicola]TIB85332.1 hypothetical protein E3Q20_03285 [Wallemia mellicola]TIB97415.1 hypothetical protein E3Q17_03397 [Wallemia mellicola]
MSTAITPAKAKELQVSSTTPGLSPFTARPRLLWRGCLLSQGWPLEGVCFTTNILPLPSPMVDGSVQDLTLALEMTRHQPLHIRDRLNLNLEKWTIENTNIRVWIDPRAIMTVKWIERVFGNPLSSSTHLHAVIVSIDDIAEDPDPSNEFIIFHDTVNESLNIGRRRKREKEKANVARPDDPLPRTIVPAQPKLAPLDRLNVRKSSSELSRLFPTRPSSSRQSSSDKDKLQMKPPEMKRKRSSLVPNTSSISIESRAASPASSDNSVFGTPTNNQTETINKSSIKKQMIATFANYNITRSHPEFNDLWSICNKGVAFALRHKINMDIIERQQIDSIVLQHLSIYLPIRPSSKVVQ